MMTKGGFTEYIVRTSVRLRNAIELLQEQQDETHAGNARVAVQLFLLIIALSSLSAVTILFYSTAKSFELFNTLDPDTGYAVSYSRHRVWQHRLQLSTVLSVIVMTVVVFNGVFIGGERSFAASYTINCSGTSGSPTSVTESTYGAGDVLTFSDTGGDGYCELDEAIDVGAGSITIESGVVLTHVDEDVTGVDLTAATVVVSGNINVAQRGCRGGGSGSANGYTPNSGTYACEQGSSGNVGYGEGAGLTYAGGGGYGGIGAGNANGADPAQTYGDPLDPLYLGSGGGGGNDGGNPTTGKDGGGLIRLTASISLTIDGVLNANGGSVTGTTRYASNGAGSGGGVYVSAGVLSGDGSVSADGGGNASVYSGAAGGGRVAIFYSSYDEGENTLLDSVTATGGVQDQNDYDGANGTVWLQNTTSNDADADSGVITLTEAETVAAVDVNNTTTLELDADQNFSGDMAVGASATLINNAALTLTGDLTVDGIVTHDDEDPDFAITAEDITVNASGSINTDNKGCTAGQSGGNGEGPDVADSDDDDDTTECIQSQSGYGDGGDNAGGAGHGGAGGSGTDVVAGATYGSNTVPVLLGSGGGGGFSGALGGDGGGRVYLVASGTVTVDGSISANGERSFAGKGGGGSGGSIYISAATIAGSDDAASISAAGGNTRYSNTSTGAGGGGRVSLQAASMTFDTENDVDITGGENANTATASKQGDDGTLYTLVLTAPDQPTFSAPLSGAHNVSVNPALSASTYSSNGASHASSTWTVSTDAEGSNVVWQASADATNLESTTVNTSNGTFQGDLDGETALAEGTTYYATVYYTNAAGNSTAATALSFTTEQTLTTTTGTWDFSTTDEYTYNSSTIELNSGTARLLDVGGSTYTVQGISSWGKRKAVTITNDNASVLTDFQVRFNVSYDSDMQTDFDDLRFANTGGTLLDYWVGPIDDNGTGGDSSDDTIPVYVEVDSLAASTTTTIYMYYDNDAADSSSSGDDTFIWYDGFETFTGWEIPPGESGDLDQSSDRAYTGTYSALKDTNGDPNGKWKSLGYTQDRDNIILEFSGYRVDDSPSIDRVGFGKASDDESGYGFYFNQGTGGLAVDERSTTGSGSVASNGTPGSLLDQWYIGQLVVESDSLTSNVYDLDYALHGTHSIDDTDVSTFDYLYIRGGYPYYVDDIRIRKYAETEPSVSVGTEYASAGPSDLRVQPSESGTHPTYDTLYTFTETRPEGNTGNVYYQLSNDGSTWYYHNGTEWTAVADDSTDYDTADIVNTYIPDFVSDVGTGDLYYRAYFDSSGTQQVGLSNIAVEYNKNPVAGTIPGQSLTEDTDEDAKFDLDDYFTDADDTLTYSVLDGLDASLGSMTVNGDGTVDFDLADNANGSDTIQFRATDQVGITADSNSLTVTVSAVNDAPTVSVSASNSAPTEDESSVTLTASGSDADNDSLTYTWIETVDSADACSLSSGSTATPTVALANRDSNYSCEYRVTVSDGTTSTQDTVSISVTADNDAPTVATIEDKTVTEGQQLQFVTSATDVDSSVDLSATDAEGDFTESGITVTSLFTDNDDNTGTFTWIPDENAAGSYVAGIQATDGTNTVTRRVNITVNDSGSESGDDEDDGENSAPELTKNIPHVSFAAEVGAVNVFNANTYFSDPDGDTLTFEARRNNRVSVDIDEDGNVSLDAPDSFAGTEQIRIVATDPSGETDRSNIFAVVVTETIPEESIGYVSGKAKGKGVIQVVDSSGQVIASWQAFKKGGVVPRLETSRGETYVVAMKRKAGSTVHVYSTTGKIQEKKRISRKVHYRKIGTGQLDEQQNVEIVTATKRGSTVYFKIFSYNPQKNRIVLRKRAKYRGIKGKQYRTVIQKKRIKLVNKKGKTKFIWKPFAQ